MRANDLTVARSAKMLQEGLSSRDQRVMVEAMGLLDNLALMAIL
jgi:hypothetical protein